MRTRVLIAVGLLWGAGLSAGTYEDAFTSKTGRKGSYTEDINMWVYTSEFAKRFGMPKEWIDDSLKGADAVAFRVETRTARDCNLFRDPSNCQIYRQCIARCLRPE